MERSGVDHPNKALPAPLHVILALSLLGARRYGCLRAGGAGPALPIGESATTNSDLCTQVPALTHLPCLVSRLPIAQGAYDKVESSGNGPVLADVLSVLAMTSGKPGERETLKFKIKGGEPDIGSWGHEYVRALAGELGKNDFGSRVVMAIKGE